MTRRPGRHFLNIPGPTPVPDRVQRAIDNAVIDHRGPEFGHLGLRVLEAIKPVFKTRQSVVIYPSSGTGAWEAALVNTLSPGDGVLMYEVGQFATLWSELARKMGLKVEMIPGDWRSGVKADAIEEKLLADKAHAIKAVCVVHNETSTGVASSVPAVRKAIDRAKHPALLMVDTISSLGSMDYRHDEWGVDVSVGGSQKGLMLPPGLSFNAISEKARAANKAAKMPRAYWDWNAMFENNKTGYFPYTPATTLLYGLEEAVKMLMEEGLDNVFARHLRLAEATRRAVQGWGLENQCANPAEYSPAITAVRVPDGFDADELRRVALENFDVSLGTGLNKVKGKVFRIGHLGDTNELTIAAAISGVEMALAIAGIPFQRGGVTAALDYFAQSAAKRPKLAASA
ncbi:MAG: aminotransferase class V-fold PLP-dependent enzyme [Alphaproteobacteria bacterium]|nr:aminotransferase class V-fold PLP-dependent enzyme [Alphaproteobacteria bacterium]